MADSIKVGIAEILKREGYIVDYKYEKNVKLKQDFYLFQDFLQLP